MLQGAAVDQVLLILATHFCGVKLEPKWLNAKSLSQNEPKWLRKTVTSTVYLTVSNQMCCNHGVFPAPMSYQVNCMSMMALWTTTSKYTKINVLDKLLRMRFSMIKLLDACKELATCVSLWTKTLDTKTLDYV